MSIATVRKLRGFLAGGLACLLLSGCGFFGGGSASPTKVPDVKLDASGNVKGAIASLQRDWNGYSVNIDVLSLERHEKALRLTFVITPRSKGSTEDFPTTFFSSDYSSAADGIYLIDSANMRKYNPLHAGETCICSRNIDSLPLDEPTVLFVDFPVPPESVQQLTVVFPALGPVPSVEVA